MTWHELVAASPANIITWANDTPWARAMAACGQDARWHAEGDVWTHTKLVINELTKVESWPDFDCLSRAKLLCTALFHDAGKPATTIIDDAGRTRSPKHAAAGAVIARDVLRELGCDLNTREAIVNLVCRHGRPPYLLEKPDPARELIGLSWEVNHELLNTFALADTRGRDTQDMKRPEETIQFWKLIAEENQCYRNPYPFFNDQSRFLYYRNKLPNLHYEPREDYRCTASLMAGLPGAGKDTWLAANRPELPVVSLDAIRAELRLAPTDDQGAVVQLARERCREYLRAGRNFALNATNIVRQTRARWIDLFADYDARVEIVYLEPALDVILSRNRNRANPVPNRVMAKLIDKLEPPTLTEAHAVELIG